MKGYLKKLNNEDNVVGMYRVQEDGSIKLLVMDDLDVQHSMHLVSMNALEAFADFYNLEVV